MTKIILDPNEDNELGFNLSIEGKTSDVDSTKPDIRFIVKERSTNQAVMFDNIKHESGAAKVTLPSTKGMFSEGKQYVGSLEVILGKHYFVATTVDLEFVEPLKVEASVVLRNSKGESMLAEKVEPEEELRVASEIDSVIIKAKPVRPSSVPVIKEVQRQPEAAPAKTTPTTQKKLPAKNNSVQQQRPALSYKNLTDKEKLVVNTIFIARCKKIGVKNPGKYLKEGTDFTKQRLLAMVGEATKLVLSKRSLSNK